jgi:hypothetical protein
VINIHLPQYLRKYLKKFETTSKEYLGAQGMIHEKKPEVENLCQTPFKIKKNYIWPKNYCTWRPQHQPQQDPDWLQLAGKISKKALRKKELENFLSRIQ